jgi:hypothetical protein
MPTPLRNVRVADGVWDAAKARAAADGVTLASVITAALEAYGSGRPVPAGQREAVPADTAVPTDGPAVPTAEAVAGTARTQRRERPAPSAPPAADPVPGVAGEPRKGSCKHPNMRIRKGVCPDCYEWVPGR